MRDIFLISIWVTLIVLGLRAPFILAGTYVWFELFSPAQLAFGLAGRIPMSLITGLLLIGLYLTTDRKMLPPPLLGIVLVFVFAIWITLTTFWAAVPDAAWPKWDWAFKNVLFCALIPFLFRTRNQIEYLLLVIIGSLGGHIVTAGIKTVISGGGYGINLTLLQSNSGFAESSTFAAYCVAMIPVTLHLNRHSRLIPNWQPIRRIAFYCYTLLSAVATIGTYARTGLMALGIFGISSWWGGKRKVLWAVLALLGATVLLPMVTSSAWQARMNTIETYDSDSSAAGRLAVWAWTVDYVKSHPFGGGFNVFLINSYSYHIPGSDQVINIKGKAFHSIYFEVLGEHGIVGFAIYIMILTSAIRAVRWVKKTTKGDPELEWAHDAAKAFLVSIATLLVGGAFVGIGFQSVIYYFVGLAFALKCHVLRAGVSSASPVPARHPAKLAPVGLRKGPAVQGASRTIPGAD
jgi:putative inorganic carbon (HCO3(-)) transporter